MSKDSEAELLKEIMDAVAEVRQEVALLSAEVRGLRAEKDRLLAALALAAPPESFGVRLRRLRKERGLTQQALADKAGMSRDGLVKLELGTRGNAKGATITRLASALGVSVVDLLDGLTDDDDGSSKH